MESILITNPIGGELHGGGTEGNTQVARVRGRAMNEAGPRQIWDVDTRREAFELAVAAWLINVLLFKVYFLGVIVDIR